MQNYNRYYLKSKGSHNYQIIRGNPAGLSRHFRFAIGGMIILGIIMILVGSVTYFISRDTPLTEEDASGVEMSWSVEQWHPKDIRSHYLKNTETASQVFKKNKNEITQLVDKSEEFVVVEYVLGVAPGEESKTLDNIAIVESEQEVEDEFLGLLASVGEDPSDPDAIAFLVPLEGLHGEVGLRYGRPLKHILDNLTQAAEAETGLYPLRQDSSSEFMAPTSILVRDSEGDPDIARKLTQHFYEGHGTTRYFGYISDEEAVTIAQWARIKAPGARFVSPTASSPYLDGVKNLARVQPSASILAKAVADLLAILNVQEPLILARASIHTDAFLTLLQQLRIRPHKTIQYYEASMNVSNVVNRVKAALENCHTPCPILLLGHVESWNIILEADQVFSAIWILPYTAQYQEDPPETFQSEVLTFIYRAHDTPEGQYLIQNELLNPVVSVIEASKALLMGKKRSWHGSYVVTATLPVASLAARVRLVGEVDNTLPLLQYDITTKGLVRHVYHELFVTPEVLKSLITQLGDGCQLVARYVEEMTGQVLTYKVEVNSALPSLVIPAERGAHLHIDCPGLHANLVCKAPEGSWSPVTCKGELQGSHGFKHQCGSTVGVAIYASRGCSIGKGLICKSDKSDKSDKTLGCLLSGLCVSKTHPPPIFSCDGIHLDSLTRSYL